jgi:RNA polymerase sigma-70 factor, ECF subfamily
MRHDARPRHDQSSPSPLSGPDETALVAAVRNGDRGALESIYRAYYQRLVGFVYAYIKSEPVAEELVQELFLAIWRHRERWEIHTTLRAYLFKSARNRALNQLKHEGVTTVACESAVAERRTIAMGEAPPDPMQVIEADELATAAQRAIARLPPRCRMAFTLCRAQGLSYAETAQVMGISEHTVKVQMTRALTALRSGLAHWLP